MTKQTLASTLAAIIAALTVTAVFWLGGFSFNERGETAVAWFLASLFGAFFAFAFATTFELGE